ncbi:type II toxin-antitoxin system RelE/ParE family toxin [Achromobacter sp. Marseille-Q0513]|uniref:type II toxin-antitoxin system RelE/ParE family toxin n=1 Tax=Achromobacter sp. Marseille-Q0513 TaxID=2829161 RepID=UPI001B9002B0|nr:type II toxin-antitoxin system RelE/ParE family toxin [Achromobacter sp. Marseille-Q0513]
MPQIIVSASALRGLKRCQEFLTARAPFAVKQASQTIASHLGLLKVSPYVGRPVRDLPALRELVISFGNSGYLALYYYDITEDAIYILAFRHQRELAY